MFNIPSKYLSFLNNMPHASLVAHITRDILTFISVRIIVLSMVIRGTSKRLLTITNNLNSLNWHLSDILYLITRIHEY